MDSITEAFIITIILFISLGLLELIVGIWYQIKFNKKYKTKEADHKDR